MNSRLRANIYTDPTTRDFILFALEFSKNVPNLKLGFHHSKDRQFAILLESKIKVRNQRGVLIASLTPARVNHVNGLMEVAKEQFQDFSFAMRMFILLHEWFHLKLHTELVLEAILNPPKQEDLKRESILASKRELEVDLEAARVFLALGFPEKEALFSMTKVFRQKTAKNDLRVQNLLNYIHHFKQ